MGTDIFSEMSEKRLDFQVFCNIVEFILCLPGSTAPAERIFSDINTMWSKEKPSLPVETMRAMLVRKIQNVSLQMLWISGQTLGH
jgi:hypothetical protein